MQHTESISPLNFPMEDPTRSLEKDKAVFMELNTDEKATMSGLVTFFSRQESKNAESTIYPSDIPTAGMSTSHPLNRGKRWTAEEEDRLVRLYVEEEKGVDEIAELFGRSSFAIVCRLVFLDLISSADTIRGYNTKIPEFERIVELKGTNEEMVLPAFVRREKVPKVKAPKPPRVPKIRVPKTSRPPGEKVTRSTNRKRPKTYRQMIIGALESLVGSMPENTDKKWASRNYIKKYLETNYNAVSIGHINRTIHKMLAEGILVQPPGNFPNTKLGVYSLASMGLPFPKPRARFTEYDDDESSEESDGPWGSGESDKSSVEDEKEYKPMERNVPVAQVTSCDSSEE